MDTTNKELSRIFAELADALEFNGDASFKIIAYRRVSRVLEDSMLDVKILAETGKLRDIPGVGVGIAKKIEEYLATGKMKKHEEILSHIPKGILDLLRIQNLGPKTLSLAYKELGVKDLNDLRRVVENGTLTKLFRMGYRKVENIRKGIDFFLQSRERIPLYEAVEISRKIIDYLKTYSGVEQVSPAGSLRRMKETVGDIDILATGKKNEAIVNFFVKYPQATNIYVSGKTKGSIVVKTKKDARQVDLRIVPTDSFGAALQYFTGSKLHNIKLRRIAREKGLKISEYGVFKENEKIAGRTEKEVYEATGLPYIPPEIREDRGELEAAHDGKLPKLVELSDIKGDLHVHSNCSDGRTSLKDVVEAARVLGYTYIAICDHSKSAKYAGGLTETRLLKQMEEIDKLNKEIEEITVLKGIEVDILSTGNLDINHKLLEKLDLVVAAIHMGFKKDVTTRLTKAIENPCVDIIAHPTGRLILKREGYDVDLDTVMEKASEQNKVLELNACPNRFDLNDLQLRKAKNMKIKISIGTDAHSIVDLSWMQFGVGLARRGWLEKKDVINTLSYPQVLRDTTKS